MGWRQHIVADPDVLLGKAVVRGTRLSVDFLLGLMAEGWTPQQLVENDPQLNDKAPKAVFAFAQECLRDGSCVLTSKASQ